MTGPEVMRAFDQWCQYKDQPATLHDWAGYADCYPLNVGISGQLGGQWYVRERMPGTRVWRMEADGSFTLLGNPSYEVRAP